MKLAAKFRLESLGHFHGRDTWARESRQVSSRLGRRKAEWRIVEWLGTTRKPRLSGCRMGWGGERRVEVEEVRMARSQPTETDGHANVDASAPCVLLLFLSTTWEGKWYMQRNVCRLVWIFHNVSCLLLLDWNVLFSPCGFLFLFFSLSRNEGIRS